MPSKNAAKKPNQPVKSRRKLKISLIVAAAILALWLVIDLVGIGGNIRFYAKWAECGQKPYVFDIGDGYIGPLTGPMSYKLGDNVSLVRLSPDQFCTALEAELAGLSASRSQYEYPTILKERGGLCRYPGDPESTYNRDFKLCSDVLEPDKSADKPAQ